MANLAQERMLWRIENLDSKLMIVAVSRLLMAGSILYCIVFNESDHIVLLASVTPVEKRNLLAEMAEIRELAKEG